ncbi:DUF4892 domain-containing protein [Pseudomonas sp. LS1212]|uniref:DUF4892 domain-containing protein n=1 Tax=Pseudomonas sp. LS1212 TaxID=2972478 RepID=UPI00215C2CBF|nr:DUF4892 domain-containing protein [Pseudomonas sp. LS1212]UVJ42453.1 DUF4892 domain-containing protein [Pseudomonas sp. LS1212]
MSAFIGVSGALRMTVLGLLLASPALSAAEGDLDLLRPLDAKVVDQRGPAPHERLYPLGSLRKISGQLRMEGQIDSRGQVSSITYELPPELKANDAFTAAREALQARGGYVLFWCQARECGESSLWINEIFNIPRLSGGDEQQAFLLLRKAEPAHNTLVALYSITRGNRKAYLHAEEFVADAPLGDLLPTAATILRELRSTRELDYPDLDGEPPKAWVTLLSRSLNLDSTLRVSLSGKQGEAWRQALVAAGVREARLEAGNQDVPGLHIELIR